MSRNRRRKRASRHRGRKAVLIIIIVIAALYVAGILYFHKFYLPNTTVADRDVSLQQAEDLREELEETAAGYQLTVTDRTGGENVIAGTDISYQYSDNGEEEEILQKQPSWQWPVSFFLSYSYELTLSSEFDEEQLETVVSSMDFMQEENMTAPEDARIDTSDGVELVEEVEGTTTIASQVIAEISAAIGNQETVVTLSDDCYEQPSVRSTDAELAEAKEAIEQYKKSSVTYEIGGKTEKLSSDEIAGFLTVSDDLTVSISEEKVATYVQALASKYNTYGDVRKFKTSLGDTIKIGGGDYGWVIDKDGEAAQLLEDIASYSAVTREPVWEQEAVQYDGSDDIGDTYIEVDYTNQHMYYYEDGELMLESDIVSGTMSTGNGTPDGVFKIAYKQSPATLVGEDYESPVNYFMPFAYNIGFHDADDWRSAYGGSIYQTNGSHGCVNMPGNKAKKLYNLVEVDTPVVAYYRTSVELTSENAEISNAYSYVDPDEED